MKESNLDTQCIEYVQMYSFSEAELCEQLFAGGLMR